MIKLLTAFLLTTGLLNLCFAQEVLFPDISKINEGDCWKVINRQADILQENNETIVHLNSAAGDGAVLLNDSDFDTGVIEIDIKGTNEPGKSFVGLAFHIADDTSYDAVYFRPFLFKSSDSTSFAHGVQYICQPEYTWSRLRQEKPGQYEKPVNPVPEPDDFFHVKIFVEHPGIKVFVNNSEIPSLFIDEILPRKGGMIALWVGNFSEGWFKNLKITNIPQS